MPENSPFTDLVLGNVSSSRDFKPTATYDPDGDCIEFLASPEPFYGERVDELVTIYYRQGTQEIVGALFKGVSKWLSRKFPGFLIDIEDGKIKLALLLQLNLWSSPPDGARVQVHAYRKLIRVAEQSGAEAELCLA